MQVQFSVEECHRMFEAVIDELVALDMDKKDRATLRRWRSGEMTPGSALMQRLAEKINTEVQQSHDRSEVSAIKKPDWVR
ncbi:MAG: hypothetical protein M0R73_05505 [Dehalococcoidia bacterium]|nr:hypothetical protein [Dehalococcoidia bacterium]